MELVGHVGYSVPNKTDDITTQILRLISYQSYCQPF